MGGYSTKRAGSFNSGSIDYETCYLVKTFIKSSAFPDVLIIFIKVPIVSFGQYKEKRYFP